MSNFNPLSIEHIQFPIERMSFLENVYQKFSYDNIDDIIMLEDPLKFWLQSVISIIDELKLYKNLVEKYEAEGRPTIDYKFDPHEGPILYTRGALNMTVRILAAAVKNENNIWTTHENKIKMLVQNL
jgi:hypothetical protein